MMMQPSSSSSNRDCASIWRTVCFFPSIELNWIETSKRKRTHRARYRQPRFLSVQLLFNDKLAIRIKARSTRRDYRGFDLNYYYQFISANQPFRVHILFIYLYAKLTVALSSCVHLSTRGAAWFSMWFNNAYHQHIFRTHKWHADALRRPVNSIKIVFHLFSLKSQLWPEP